MREDVTFPSGGELCHAWVYGAQGAAPGKMPCIVMAHGLGGTRDAGLEPYAELFARSGYSVLLFDYRHFGASEGEPRQLVSISHQLADWAAAIGFARALPSTDAARLFLWGSSFSGGHVVVAAARDGAIAGVSAQGPMMDGLAAVLNIISYAGIGRALHLTWLGLRDQIGAWLGRAPVYVPLVAPVGTCAVMATADAEPGYRAIAPKSWRNEMAARLALTLSFYRPYLSARQLTCPILILACEVDSVAPSSAARKAARLAGDRATLKLFPFGHFDFYIGEGFAKGSAAQLAFFNNLCAKTHIQG